MQFFEGIFFFKATNNTKTNKSLSCCQLGASIFFFFFSVIFFQNAGSQLCFRFFLQRLSYFFVFVLFVALKKRIPSKICILSCFICLKSVLLKFLCFWSCFKGNPWERDGVERIWAFPSTCIYHRYLKYDHFMDINRRFECINVNRIYISVKRSFLLFGFGNTTGLSIELRSSIR